MGATGSRRPLGIFVSYASGCLTDHEPHGDGLICFSLLNGLARRGHKVFAYAPYAPIRNGHPNLHVRVRGHRVPADSLAGWEHLWRSERWLRELLATEQIDLAWRMHPYGEACPGNPPTGGRPLVIGPLFRDWPANTPIPRNLGRPRFGFGIGKYLRPLARRGWRRAMQSAALLLCATPAHVRAMQAEYPGARVHLTPVIVDPLPEDHPRARWLGQGRFQLLFVANLYPGKNAGVFCEIVGELRRRGVDASGTIIGDGDQRSVVEELIAARELGNHVHLLGKLANSEVFRHLRASHLLVSASVGEPYGRGIAEAMAVGTPCVCHRSGGPSEFITNNQDGLLVNELTPSAFTEAILPVAADPDFWNRLSTESLQTATGWRPDVVLEAMEDAFYELIEGSPRRCPNL